MILQPPSYGPVLGLTTETTVRLMAGIEDLANKFKVYSGYLRFKKVTDLQWGDTKKNFGLIAISIAQGLLS